MILRAFLLSVVVCFLSLTSLPAFSAPKPGMTTDQILIKVVPGAFAGEVNVFLVWPTTTPGMYDCLRTSDASRQWQTELGRQIPNGAVTLTSFAVNINPPGALVTKTQAEMDICQAMTNQLASSITATPVPPAVPALYIIVATISGQTDRPLYNAQFAPIGRVEFLLNGTPRICEPAPVYKTGSTVKYYWVTNNANQRGLAVCKPQ